MSLTITLQEASDIIGVSKSTYSRWCHKGVVPKPIPGARRFVKRDVENALSPPEKLFVKNEESFYNSPIDAAEERLKRRRDDRSKKAIRGSKNRQN